MASRGVVVFNCNSRHPGIAKRLPDHVPTTILPEEENDLSNVNSSFIFFNYLFMMTVALSSC